MRILIAQSSPLETIGGITVAVFGAVAAVTLVVKLLKFLKGEPEAPKLIGAIVPELGDGLDLNKRYDVIYGGDYHSSFVERLQCVCILGYVGDNSEASKMYMRGR